MAVNRTLENRWIRRYKTFFFFGIFILILQLYLAVKFLTLNAPDTNDLSKKNIEKFTNLVNSVDSNSVQHLKDEDDEDSAVNSNSVNIYKVEPHFNDKPASKLNRTNLHLDELEFTPICDVHSKDAISAVHRAKSQYCKQHIVNVTCLIQQGRLYPISLENYCPHKDLHAGRSLGCYQDNKTYRLLSGYYANYKTNNSPEHCIRMCLQSGFVYAGVQYSTECFCGNDQPPSSARLPDPSCNMKCPANPRKACGGYFTINIFETGIAAFTPQQAELKTLQRNNNVRIVYLLTLNGRAVRQVKRLIKALFHLDNYFYIHVDARQDYMYRELLILEKQFSNIRLTRKRYATIWGGASLLKMLLNSMSELLTLEQWKWDFIINLSESDFPVKTTNKLVDFLTANRNKNFVKSHGREVQRFIQKQGLDKTFIECDAHMWRIGDRQLPWGIQIDGGSDWVALSRSFIKFVTNEDDTLLNGLLTIFNYTLLPAESFFHTVLRNSKFCNTYIDNNLHVTNWKRKLGCKCQYKHVVDWCGCSPNDFKPDDWPRILSTESKQLYFARKFEPVVNQGIILQLEEWLFGPYSLNVTNINSYWQSIYHHADLSPSSDDAVHTIANSLLRLTINKLRNAHKCSIKQFKLIEVTAYFSNDIHKGIVLTYDINTTNSIRMESFIKYQSNVLISKTSSSILKRLKTFYVSTEYDQKEQISRNFGRFIGPFSEPALIYEFLPNVNIHAKPVNITILWIDPIGYVVDVVHVHIDINYVLNFIRLSHKGPLLPGIWIVKLIYDRNVLAQTIFLISPLEFIGGIKMTQTQSQIVNGGGSLNTRTIDKHWQQYGGSDTDKIKLKSLSTENSKLINTNLQKWIDKLVNKFYKIHHFCIYNNLLTFQCENNFLLDVCSSTIWSTVAFDPKSDIKTSIEYLKFKNNSLR